MTIDPGQTPELDARDLEATDEGAAGLAEFDRDVILATGRTVRVRPARPDDLDALRRLYDGLSDSSSYTRFFRLRPVLPDSWLLPTPCADVRHALLLLALDDHEVIGVGELRATSDPEEAEVAFAVADAHQHEGIATILLEDLAVLARDAGFLRLVAETLVQNDAMRGVFRSVGLAERTTIQAGELHVELDLGDETLLEDRADLFDWTATVASLDALLRPDHVVVIGAGRRVGSVGRSVLANLVESYDGRLSVVHPSETSIGGVEAVPDLQDLDTAPDLAVICVPAESCVDAVDRCGRAGVSAAVVVSAGFAEAGADGGVRQAELVAAARRHGMRLVGPNCLGVVSTVNGLNATFLRHPIPIGSIAVGSQSGGVGIVLASEASKRQLGISSFVSLGNKADVSGNDLLRVWADDPATSVVLLYLESIGDPRRFARVARAVSRKKPVVALKSGRSAAGRRGARSHTAAMATDEVTTEALFAHTGVVRVDTLDQLLDVASLFARYPDFDGQRVALVGNSGGPLILAADAAAASGLDVVELSQPLRDRLRALVPDAASTVNPVDLLSTVTPTATAAVVAEIARSGEVDACVVLAVALDDDAPGLELDLVGVDLPVVAVVMGGLEGPDGLPVYPTPERAMDALGRAARRGTWLRANAAEGQVRTDLDLVRVRREIRRLALTAATGADGSGAAVGSDWLAQGAALTMVEQLGIPVAAWRSAADSATAVRCAEELRLPCVMKADVSGIVHKSDEGAVVLRVRSIEEVRRTAEGFADRFADRLDAIILQEQVPAGVELLIGAVRDPLVGPLVMVAAGGTEAELFADRACMLAPVTRTMASAAVTSLRMWPLLNGYRGRPVVPAEQIVDIIQRIGAVMAAVPEIAEVEMNPVIGTGDRVVAVDARVRLSLAAVQPLRALRHG